MSNIKNIVTNRTGTKNKTQMTDQSTCNCRRKIECPLRDNCLAKSLIYQASVNSETGTETYIGLTANNFKTRFNSHTASFRSNNLRKSTPLSKYIRTLKDSNTNCNINWKICTKMCTTVTFTSKYYISFRVEKRMPPLLFCWPSIAFLPNKDLKFWLQLYLLAPSTLPIAKAFRAIEICYGVPVRHASCLFWLLVLFACCLTIFFFLLVNLCLLLVLWCLLLKTHMIGW